MIEFAQADHHEMLSHYLLYGAAAMCEAGGVVDVRMSWSRSMNPRPRLSGDGLTSQRLAELVHAHALRCTASTSWLQAASPLEPKRAVMSPRLAAVGEDPDRWAALQQARHQVEDVLDDDADTLSAAFVGALGEPAYWRRRHNGNRLQDDGGSRLEMQPRNQGSEFVGSRLRGLAQAVASRRPGEVLDGLLGNTVVDEMGKGGVDSRTATNLRPPGPTDSAQAWVALWGISQVELVHRVTRASTTATHLPRRDAQAVRGGTFTLPMWEMWWRPAKLRAILGSGELRRAAEVFRDDPADAVAVAVLRQLRTRHGIGTLISFPVDMVGSMNAPERRTLRGRLLPLPE